MRFGVYGNCQAYEFGACLGALLPDSKADVFLESNRSPAPNPTEYDLFFVQPSYARRFDDYPNDNIRLFPTVVFTGFHPDCMYLFPNMKVVQSPFGDYHSSLVASCFVLGIPSNEVAFWVNAAKFTEIGYLAEFGRAKKFLLESARSAGFDLNDVFERWMKRGTAFVYTINHPAIYVSYDICRLALIKEGFTDLSENPMPRDRLAEAGWWPVYDLVAKHLGIAEQALFKFSQERATREGRESLSFDEFVAKSYRIYNEVPREAITGAPPVARVLKAIARAIPKSA